MLSRIVFVKVPKKQFSLIFPLFVDIPKEFLAKQKSRAKHQGVLLG